MDSFREKIAVGENFLEKLMRKIPGFEGYKNREQSRNADQIQRKFMAASLREGKGRIGEAAQEMMRSKGLEFIDDVDRITKIMDKVTDRVEHAEYGYSSLFSSTKVDTEQLDSLYEYDLGMLLNIESISEAITGLEGTLEQEDGDIRARLKDIKKAIDNLNQKIDGRIKLLKGVE